MYNLTVDEAHTFFVGNGKWLVHNTCEFPRTNEVGDWDNRTRGFPEDSRTQPNTGIYEYSNGNRIYVGEAHGQSLGGRLNSKKRNWGNNPENIIFTRIEFTGDARYTATQYAQFAERVRIEQLMTDVGIENVSNATRTRIIRTASRADTIAFMNTDIWREVVGWSDWLTLPENLVELPARFR